MDINVDIQIDKWMDVNVDILIDKWMDINTDIQRDKWMVINTDIQRNMNLSCKTVNLKHEVPAPEVCDGSG